MATAPSPTRLRWLSGRCHPRQEVWVRSLQWLTEPLLGEQEDIELGSSGWMCLGSSREFPGREQGGPWGMCIPLEMLPSILHIILAVPYRTGFKIVLEITFLCGIIHTASGVCHVFFPPWRAALVCGCISDADGLADGCWLAPDWDKAGVLGRDLTPALCWVMSVCAHFHFGYSSLRHKILEPLLLLLSACSPPGFSD